MGGGGGWACKKDIVAQCAGAGEGLPGGRQRQMGRWAGITAADSGGCIGHRSRWLLKSKQKNSNFVKEEGKYLSIYHFRGLNKSLKESYKTLLNYIETNNLKVDDSFYEEIILDELSVKNYDEYKIKISVKILDY